MNEDVRLVEDLVAGFPVLEGSYRAHVFNEDGVLPHVFFWEVTREVVSSFVAQGPESLDWRSVLAFLEARLGRGIPEADTVICTSFLLYLPYPGDPGHGIVDHLGPAMRRKFQELRP